jgi:hypothetical protein
MMNGQTKAPVAENEPRLTKQHHTGNSTSAQRQRLLERLRHMPITTLEARSQLDILMPATRVFELRKQGFEIDTFRTLAPTECGKSHSVARYVLRTDVVTGVVAPNPISS